MFIQLVFCLISCQGKFTVHSPDKLRDLDIPYSFANYGNPAIVPKYGRIRYEFLSECKFNGTVSGETALLIDYKIECYSPDLIFSAYEAGANFIIILDESDSLSYNISSPYYTDELYEDFTALLIPKSFYINYFSKYESVWISYEFDYEKSNLPYVELILSGNRNQEYYIVKDLLYIVDKYHLDYNNFKIRIDYLYPIDVDNEDCITYIYNSYCAYKNYFASGSLILQNLLASLTFYNTFPKINDSIHIFLKYLLHLYDKCKDDYSIDCNYNAINDYGGSIIYNETLLLDAHGNKDPDSHLVINGKYFPWFGSIELGYCSSFYNIPFNCLYCFTSCYTDIQSMQTCIPDCNNTFCGYSNLNCLEIEETKCYYFMLNDGNCNSVCKLEKDCPEENNGQNSQGSSSNQNNNNSGQGNANSTVQKDEISVSIILIAVLIPISFCFCGAIVIISVRVIIKKNHKSPTVIQSLRLSAVRYNSNMKIRGDKICVIDLMGIHENDMVIITPCQHIFHPQCIREWIGNHTNNPDRSCPICKTSLREFCF
ncbi:hypothetical protein SteCoe_37770 [Stentor coeruleus]|uniref:RING-type domain-containing protein n=1 Tax=Stentor coeruleus TaxID=5963 RepID=A0A1R2AMG6_9CILI|nr:hypothetical protein SteCoe_37770 [Stentor coeruleus]